MQKIILMSVLLTSITAAAVQPLRTFYNKLSGSPDKTIIKYCDSLVMLQIPLLAQVSRPVPCDYFFCRCECG